MLNIVVTGAAGFIGSHTCDQFVAEGHQVLGIDNFRTGRAENLTSLRHEPKFRLEERDVAVDGALLAPFEVFRPHVIVHCAGLVSVPESIADPALNRRLNLTATRHLAKAARACEARRVVFASSAAIYGASRRLPLTETGPAEPLSPYGTAKLASERLLLRGAASLRLEALCLRYFNVYGPRQHPSSDYSGVISRFHARLQQDLPPVIFGDGKQTRDFIHVRDVAAGNVLAATRPAVTSRALNICTGQAVDIARLASLIADHFPSAPPPVHEKKRRSDIRHSVGAPDEARRTLGFSASVPLNEGLAELLSAATSRIGKGSVPT